MSATPYDDELLSLSGDRAPVNYDRAPAHAGISPRRMSRSQCETASICRSTSIGPMSKDNFPRCWHSRFTTRICKDRMSQGSTATAGVVIALGRPT